MAQHEPWAYGGVLALAVLLVGALKVAISKITGGKQDGLSEVLQHDLDGLQKRLEIAEEQAKEYGKAIAELASDIKLIKFRLGIDGDQR